MKNYLSIQKKLNKINSKDLDKKINTLHYQEFEKFECLSCSNCCKTLGPRLSDIDIKRLSENLKIKTSEFIEKYLKIDEDNDFVFKKMPCPFLIENNFCTVYKNRPKACREYPHTNQKNIKSILNICLKNIEYCPVVKKIFNAI